MESFELQSDQMKKLESRKPEDLDETEEDQLDQEFLDKFENEATSVDLGNLYTSCLEWILDKPISTLDSQLMIDDYDKIQYPAAIELIINLVSQSNDLLRQRALMDFYMLSQWDKNNGHLLLFHQKFHGWLLDLLLPYQYYIDEQDENCRAVYDMGCKLHTLLLTNSSLNPEYDTFKKLNFISRYPLSVDREKRLTAEKLSRVLLINLINSLNPFLQKFKEGQLQGSNKQRQPEDQSDAEMLTAWKNFAHIIQLSEEMIFTSNHREQNREDGSQTEADDESANDDLINKRSSQVEEGSKDYAKSRGDNINLNQSLLDWQKSQGYLLYFETMQINDLNINEIVSQWAEWEILETVFQNIEIMTSKLGLMSDEEENQSDYNLGNGQLILQHEYQVSTQIIQENVFESLERFYQSQIFEQDIQLLMRECLIGN